jgi:N-acetylglutamate synthase-like GNAT family acetyltransferase
MNIREANGDDIDGICRLLSVLFEQESEFKPEYEAQKKGVAEILVE